MQAGSAQAKPDLQSSRVARWTVIWCKSLVARAGGKQMATKLFALCAIALLSGCASQPFDQQAAKAELQQMYAQWAKAFEAKDVDGVMAMYAPGDALTAYDI